MQENSSLFSLSIDDQTKTQLNGAAFWARIFAMTGVILLAIAFARTIYSVYRIGRNDNNDSYLTTERVGSIAGYSLIYVIPMLSLIFVLRFANKMKRALNAEDQSNLISSFQHLKIYFRYIAILSILLVCILAISWLIQLTKGGY